MLLPLELYCDIAQPAITWDVLFDLLYCTVSTSSAVCSLVLGCSWDVFLDGLAQRLVAGLVACMEQQQQLYSQSRNVAFNHWDVGCCSPLTRPNVAVLLCQPSRFGLSSTLWSATVSDDAEVISVSRYSYCVQVRALLCRLHILPAVTQADSHTLDKGRMPLRCYRSAAQRLA